MKSLNLAALTLFSGILATSLITFDFKASASELNPTNVRCIEDTKATGVLGQVSGFFGRQEITPKYCTSAAVPSGVTFEDEKAENLTYGKGRCVNRGTVTLQPISSNRLQYKWYYSDGKLVGDQGRIDGYNKGKP